MYPLHLASLIKSVPRENKIFVAMSFDDTFKSRWENVISPAISRLKYDNKILEPIRVDANVVSDSISREIVHGITNYLLVFADITSINVSDKISLRNANVMYEVGLAHALRQPDEVLLFRSDTHRLPFDISDIRIRNYNPDGNRAEAITIVMDAVTEAIKAIDFRQDATVRQTARKLDIASIKLLLLNKEFIQVPANATMGNVVANSQDNAAIRRMLELGILRTFINEYNSNHTLNNPRPLCYYEITEFGKQVSRVVKGQLGIDN